MIPSSYCPPLPPVSPRQSARLHPGVFEPRKDWHGKGHHTLWCTKGIFLFLWNFVSLCESITMLREVGATFTRSNRLYEGMRLVSNKKKGKWWNNLQVFWVIINCDTFISESEFLEGVHPRMAGALILRHDPQGSVSDLYWLHTTRTMGVCYMTTNDQKPKVIYY